MKKVTSIRVTKLIYPIGITISVLKNVLHKLPIPVISQYAYILIKNGNIYSLSHNLYSESTRVNYYYP
jgi:hypothetical protein